MKESIAALMSARPCSQRNHERSTADWSAVLAAGHGSQTATGPIVSEEEEKRRAELLRAQEQLKKCLEKKDYRGAGAEQDNISALMSAEPKPVEKEEEQEEGEKRQAELRRVDFV